MSDSADGVATIQIKVETVKDLDGVSVLDEGCLKHEVAELPTHFIISSHSVEIKGSSYSQQEKSSLIDIKSKTGEEKNGAKSPPRKKSKQQIRHEATLFDTNHVSQLVTEAFKYYDLSIDEFAEFVLAERDKNLVRNLIENPKVWTKSNETEKHIYQRIAKWLHKTIKDRIAPVNEELNRRGLPSKQISVPDTSELTAREVPKPKNGLRSTSDLLSQLRSQLLSLGISLSDFAEKVLGDASVLNHQPVTKLDELDSQNLQKFLIIQQWLCLPTNQKMDPFS